MSSERVAFADASSADEVVFGDMRSLFLSLMLMIAYLLLLQSVGFILDTIVYAFLQIMILDKGGKRKWLSSLVISIASVVVIDYLFEYVFGVALPSLQLF